ncbi:MAG: hypothetical protein WCK35_15555 [Chloroflexota bacterium]
MTKDERFVTARHTLQALWKIGVAGKHQQKLLVEGLEKRFKECIVEKKLHPDPLRYYSQPAKPLYCLAGRDHQTKSPGIDGT